MKPNLIPKPYQREKSPIVFSTEGRGIVESRRLRQTPAEQREEERIKSVAWNQPGRRDAENPDDRDHGSALGRFCLRWYRDADLRFTRRRAGEQFAELVDEERVARGLHPRQTSASLARVECLDDDKLLERKEAAVRRLKEAEAAIRDGGHASVSAAYELAYHDRDIPDEGELWASNALYHLSTFFKLEKRPFRD